MQSRDLLTAAAVLLSSGRGRPSSACCCRASSTVYYAAFHFLARQCADLLIGSAGSERSIEAWQQVYRSLDHSATKTQCLNKAMLQRFPQQLQDFAILFVILQEKRHRADYDPLARFPKQEVSNDIRHVELAIAGFDTVSAKHRRAFCAYVLLKQRR